MVSEDLPGVNPEHRTEALRVSEDGPKLKKNKKAGTGEIAQWVECILCMQEAWACRSISGMMWYS